MMENALSILIMGFVGGGSNIAIVTALPLLNFVLNFV